MKKETSMYCFCQETAIGSITICANKKAITRLYFGENMPQRLLCYTQDVETNIIRKAFFQLNEYLNGIRKRFDLKTEYDGTEFQMSVWDQLTVIPYGKTKSYKDIACKINNPKSSLAIGGACGKNPIPIFIPCHRVVGSNGNITGYVGGINLKKRLLEIEKLQQI